MTSWCSILWITTFCITQCSAASIRIHNNNYATAFASVRTRSIRRHKSSSSSLLSYQIEPPIEDQQEQRISTSASVDDSSDDDAIDFVDTDIDPEVIFSDEQQQLTENTTESVEDNNWISATRTLGSLILHLKDETRDSNVDVFGRPLLSNSNNNNNNLIDQFGLPRENQSTLAAEAASGSEEEGGGSSNTSVSTGFANQFPNSLASYLLKLKRDEEDNRERIIFEEENRNRGKKRDGSNGGRGGNNDSEGNDKLPINLQLDQVSSSISWFLLLSLTCEYSHQCTHNTPLYLYLATENV